jgi:hypothetical protein
MTTDTTPIAIAQAMFDAIGNRGRLVQHSETQWTSATFTGMRDTFTIRFDGEFARSSAALLRDTIDAGDIELPGRLVVEMTAETMPYAHDHIDVVVHALTLDDTCAIHRQPASRCPRGCSGGAL